MEENQLSPDSLHVSDEEKIAAHLRLRANILQTLYHFFQEHPYSTLDLPQLMETCETEVKDLNWNLVYLEKCGFVELGKLIEAPPFIACSVSISEKGVDLVENPAEFRSKFSMAGTSAVNPAPGGYRK